jgi:GntR family transcriptional regulator, transcriptional repressor for pyruvate dehydrogenase complex
VNLLRVSLAEMRTAHDPEELVMRDIEFHAQVAAATGNASLCSILEALSTRALRARIWRASVSGMKTMTLSQHALILDALAERDAVLARSAATIHVSESERWLKEYLGASLDSAIVGDTLNGAVNLTDVDNLNNSKAAGVARESEDSIVP